MEQRTLDLINSNIIFGRLTELEFLLIPDDMQEKYVMYLANNGLSTPNWLYTSCNVHLKSIILEHKIKTSNNLTKEELADCSPEQITFYVNNLIKSGTWVSSYEIVYFTDEQREKYLSNKVSFGDYIEPELFFMLDEYHKLKYIIFYGLNNVDEPISKWYEVYEKSNNRDKQINSILDET